MCQPLIFDDIEQDFDKWTLSCFSADKFADDSARIELENKFKKFTEITDKFNRQTVSYQLSKKDSIQRWFKYKEGFSADLVEHFLNEFNISKDECVLDPFLGSGTTAFICKINGINSIGFDVLPMTKIAINAKDSISEYDVDELIALKKNFGLLEIPCDYKKRFKYISITDGAFPEQTEKEVQFYSDWIKESEFSRLAKNLFTLCMLNSLETVSYTRKDGQYLSWDSRSRKIINANIERAKRGAKPIDRLYKGELLSLKEVVIHELENDIEDIKSIRKQKKLVGDATIRYEQNSSLFSLPQIASESVDAVITSPPYCNRYDYTRTYALEMNYLGMTTEEIAKLRQSLLSCTVENKSKSQILANYYKEIGRGDDYDKALACLQSTVAYSEIMLALRKRNDAGEINNKGILRMVEGYFFELTFVYFEIYRLLKKGGNIAVVNDNVRYAGEVVPVDYLSCELAEKIGFKVKKIYTLKQKKGNSSQQMAKYGRVALRKSITVWEK